MSRDRRPAHQTLQTMNEIFLMVGWKLRLLLGAFCLVFSAVVLLTLPRSLFLISAFYAGQPASHSVHVATILLSWYAVWTVLGPSLVVVGTYKFMSRLPNVHQQWSAPRNHLMVVALSTLLLAASLPVFVAHGLRGAIDLIPYSVSVGLVTLVVGFLKAGEAEQRIWSALLNAARHIGKYGIRDLRPKAESPWYHLNCGHVCPQIQGVRHTVDAWTRFEDVAGAGSIAVKGFFFDGVSPQHARVALRAAKRVFDQCGWDGLAGLRHSIGALLLPKEQVDTERVALFDSASRAAEVVLRCIRTRNANAHVVCTDMEYQTVIDSVSRHFPEEAITVVPLREVSEDSIAPATDADILQRVENVMGHLPPTASPVVSVFSHVVGTTGQVLPMEKVYALLATYCQDRKVDLIFIIDGAHALGQVEVSMASMPNAIYIWSGHKWLFGPHSTGGIVVGSAIDEQLMSTLEASAHESFAFEGSRDRMGSLTRLDVFPGLLKAIHLFAIVRGGAQASRPLLAQSRSSLVETIEAKGRGIRVRWRRHLDQVASGMVFIEPEGVEYQNEAFAEHWKKLCESRGVLVAKLPGQACLRLCVPYYLGEGEVRAAARRVCLAFAETDTDWQARRP